MLYPSSDWEITRIAQDKLQEALRKAEVERLLNEVKPQRESWLSRLVHNLFSSLAVHRERQSLRQVAPSAMAAKS